MNKHYLRESDYERERRAARGARQTAWGLIAVAMLLALVFGDQAYSAQLAAVFEGCPAGSKLDACTPTRMVLKTPTPTDIVQECPSDGRNCWENFVPVARVFGSLAASTMVDGCDTSPDPVEQVLPWSTANDVCKGAWKSQPKTTWADASTFSASIAAGIAPVTTVLTWDVKDVTSCTASGSWSGTKAAKGTQTITGLTANARYTLTCTSPVSQPGSAALSWAPPTQNTDGTALTNLAGFRVVYGVNPAQLTTVVQIAQPTAKAYTVTGLTPGTTWHFALRAYTSTGVESVNSTTVAAAIAGSSGKAWNRSLDIAVTPAPTIPNPPTGLSVTETSAYRLDQNANRPALVKVGTVPLGTPCTSERILEKHRVERALVVLDSGFARPNVALATCAAI